MRTTKPVFEIGARLDRGLVSPDNQDFIGRAQIPLGSALILADGVGGGRGGRRAAELAVEHFLQFLRSVPAGANPGQALRDAQKLANAQIYRLGHGGDPALQGMATTVVAAIVDEWRCWIGHVGDSRAYLLRAGQLRSLTTDHSVAGSHVLTRGLGAKPDTELEVTGPVLLEAGDCLMLCSDGLWSTVAHAEIETVMRSGLSAQATAEGLVDLALQAGGPDNISVQCLRVHPEGTLLPAGSGLGQSISPAAAVAATPPPPASQPFAAFYKNSATLAGLMLVAAVSWRIATGPITVPINVPGGSVTTAQGTTPGTTTGSTPGSTSGSTSGTTPGSTSPAATTSTKPGPAPSDPASKAQTVPAKPARTDSGKKSTGEGPEKPSALVVGVVIPRWQSPAWLGRVQSSESVHVEKIEGAWPCWKLMREEPIFFFRPGAQAAAETLRKQAFPQEAPKEDQPGPLEPHLQPRLEAMTTAASACAAGRDILIVPAAISLP